MGIAKLKNAWKRGVLYSFRAGGCILMPFRQEYREFMFDSTSRHVCTRYAVDYEVDAEPELEC